LSNGYWIDVRNQLTARERKRSNSVALRGQTYTKDGGGATITDTNALADAAFYRAAAYITAWNIKDGDAPWPLTVDGLGNLPEALFDEIDTALAAHIEAVEQAAKNATSAKSIN
jgi:hypothetical protein